VTWLPSDRGFPSLLFQFSCPIRPHEQARGSISCAMDRRVDGSTDKWLAATSERKSRHPPRVAAAPPPRNRSSSTTFLCISSRGASPEWNYLLKDKKRFDVVSGSASEITIAVPYCGSVVGSLMGVEVDSAGVLAESVPDTTESVPDMLSGSHKGVILEAPGWSSVFYSLMWQGVSQQLSQHHGSEISVATSQSVLTIQSKSNCERCCCEKCKLCAGHFI